MKYGSGSLEHDHKTALDYMSFICIDSKRGTVNACGMKHVQCHINTHSAFFKDSNSQSLFQSAS